ncbi:MULTISPECIES: hypothetical protein [unclassified Leeuwenhoekiella]|uniref:hypothetical protein n=1 Tax=unclassified Leeuwenhoekiella TaxID=2615029 RepID=UPI000C56D758|nr:MULTISPECIES: hypothetical protein [unclassified Leeuwenhoekiella]MAW94403.1 hypothetical protein [Leeuwenhoekiella sp.]MBA81080.1 hypothetical protein [Leeuwenhoekiella sp.]|tara:strand:+ start:6287 stop:6928 length:642 start_codon:yes stop_codon:yes gene_type:complete
MDELEFLKQDWKRQEADLPVVSTDSLYTMIHKRSSSLMKWLLYVSIFEFVLWTVLNFLTVNTKTLESLKEIHLYEFEIGITLLQYVVLAVFIYCFYKNYKEVRTTDNTRKLMKKILNTRRTVNIYVIYNLIMVFVIGIVVFTASALYDPALQDLYVLDDDGNRHLPVQVFLVFFGSIAAFAVVIWLFYKLLYGILMRRLYGNYKKLSKLEMEE